MPERRFETLTGIRRNRRGGVFPSPGRVGSIDVRQEIVRHFRENFPLLLDGTLDFHPDPARFARQAREILADGNRPATPSAALLRETLDSIRSTPRPATRAGLAAIGPRAARVWWDSSLLTPPDGGNQPDILADLSRPRPILRFRDVTGLDPAGRRWNGVFDIDIDLAENGKTIDFWAADKTYVAEIGLAHPDGRFQRLAQTNPAALPREGRGATVDQGRVRTNLRPGHEAGEPVPFDEAETRDWLMAGPDHPGRDFRAELIIHALYRDFFREGPRALRLAPDLFRRDGDILAGEYRARARLRPRKSPALPPAIPRLLVERLDCGQAVSKAALSYPPVHVPSLAPANRLAAPDAYFNLLRDALLWMSRKRVVPEAPSAGSILPAPPADVPDRFFSPPTAKESAARRGLVQVLNQALGDPDPVAAMAEPVFAAAKNLRERLIALPNPRSAAWEEKDFADQCGGLEIQRFAKAGVRFTGLSLVLEGQTRPGASLRVAGKLVRADADGRFRLECVLSGRKTSLPLKADCPSGGDARGRINIEWEKRPAPAGQARKVTA